MSFRGRRSWRPLSLALTVVFFRLIVEWQNVLLANPSAWFETFQGPGALLDGTRQYCRVIWRKENRIGVEFE